MQSCHLCMILSTSGDTPVFVGWRLSSGHPQGLTITDSIRYASIYSVEADTYQEAHDLMMMSLNVMHPIKHFGQALTWLNVTQDVRLSSNTYAEFICKHVLLDKPSSRQSLYSYCKKHLEMDAMNKIIDDLIADGYLCETDGVLTFIKTYEVKTYG